MLKAVAGPERAEELMLTWTEKHFERGRQQGKAERSAEYLLRILAARGVHVDDKARHRIMSCTDMATLDQWFERALNAKHLSEVLGDAEQ
jgi:hypothetical protein